MGILQRVVSMTKAATNEMLDKIENPVTMLNQYLRDLEEEIASTEREAVRQQAQGRIMQAKLAELKEQANDYEKKAEQAAVEGREPEARTALEAKLLYLDQAEETLGLLKLAEQAAIELGLRTEALKEEKTRLQAKRTELTARMQQTSQASRYSAAPWHESSASKGFDRIEQKLMEREAQLELAKGRYGSVPSVQGHDQQQELRNSRVDDELKRLLQKKTGSS